jgi:hypothetical protein
MQERALKSNTIITIDVMGQWNVIYETNIMQADSIEHYHFLARRFPLLAATWLFPHLQHLHCCGNSATTGLQEWHQESESLSKDGQFRKYLTVKSAKIPLSSLMRAIFISKSFVLASWSLVIVSAGKRWIQMPGSKMKDIKMRYTSTAPDTDFPINRKMSMMPEKIAQNWKKCLITINWVRKKTEAKFNDHDKMMAQKFKLQEGNATLLVMMWKNYNYNNKYIFQCMPRLNKHVIRHQSHWPQVTKISEVKVDFAKWPS